MMFYAKTENGFGERVTNKDHCQAVSDLAGQYGDSCGLGREARAAGLIHDFGKYSVRFGQVMDGELTGIDHAISSAVFGHMLRLPRCVIESVAAHHSELLSLEELMPFLRPDNAGQVPSMKYPSMTSTEDYRTGRDAFCCDFGVDVLRSVLVGLTGNDGSGVPDRFAGNMRSMMKSRMLLSCLVDADWSVSAYEESHDPDDISEGVVLDPGKSLRKLGRLRARARTMAERRGCPGNIKQLRDMVWSDCDTAASGDARYLTLTAPTGSAKTFGFLRFGLERCRRDLTRKRIILVLPFLSLTDQVFDIAAKIVPGTVLDTSMADYSEENRMLSGRWAAPCIVTTTVQLFGSLFSNRRGDLRKLHQLSDSVIIFDEIQSLPDHLARVAMEALNILVDDYHATVLLSTATPPSYGRIPGLDFRPREVISDLDACFGMAPAEGIEYLDSEYTVRDIADMALDYQNSAVVFNMKRHAREAYDAWADRGVPNIFLLTTDLCPAHRRGIIQAIQKLQANHEPVHVAATQCIEAGVDLDFDQVFRAMAPLPSLVQSAGRQNRSRLHPRGGMKVFCLVRDQGRVRMYPDSNYEASANATKGLAMNHVDLSGLGALDAYYQVRFHADPTREKLLSALYARQYPEFTRESRLIPWSGYRVIVPHDMALYQEAMASVLEDRVTRAILARSGATSVSCYDLDRIQAHCQELCLKNHRTGAETHTGVWILLTGHEACYNPDKGLILDNDDMFMQ